MEETKYCPHCKTEYLATAQACADCGAALVWSSCRDPRAAPMPVLLADANWAAWPDDEILGELASDNEKVIEAYLGYLGVAGIRGAVLPVTRYEPRELQREFSSVFGATLTGGAGGEVPIGDIVEGFQYTVFVPRQDYERADGIIDDVFAALHPGLGDSFHGEFETGHCPACGCSVTEAAVECPDCGLSLG